MTAARTVTIPGPLPLGEPVRAAWFVSGYRPAHLRPGPPTVDPDLAADPDWPGYDDGTVVGDIEHSAIVVALENRRQNTGDDEYVTFTLVRPATADEAAPVLAREAQQQHHRDLIERACTELDTPATATKPADTAFPLRDQEDTSGFYRRLHALPHVRFDIDRFLLAFGVTTPDLRFSIDEPGAMIYVEDPLFARVHGLPLTPERRDLYRALVDAFGEADPARSRGKEGP